MSDPQDRVTAYLRPNRKRLLSALAVSAALLAAGFMIGAMLAQSAHAQMPAPDPAASAPISNPCNVPDPKTVYWYSDWKTGQVASCAPAPAGKGTLPTIRFNAVGVHAWSWCPLQDGTWGLMMGAATWERALQLQIVADAAAIARAPDPVAALSAIADKNVSTPMADPGLTPVWCPNVKEMYASRPAATTPPPPPPAWIVAPAISGSRPLFNVSGTALIVTTQRVPALASPATACDCNAAKLVVQAVLYCAPVGKAPLVAQCKLK